MTGSLPPIKYRQTHYAAFLADLVARLVAEVPPGQGASADGQSGPIVQTGPAGAASPGAGPATGGPPLAHLQVGDSGDWIVGLAQAWAALAEIFSFYQERIIAEAFLATATQPSSITHLYNSLGHSFPPNTTATTVVAYQLSAATAGPDAVSRAQAAGTGTAASQRAADLRAAGPDGAPAGPADLPGLLADFDATVGPGGVLGAPTPATASAPGSQPARRTTIPVAAQVKGLPGANALPATYVTLGQLDAQVDLSGLGVRLAAPAPPAAGPATTQLVLAGVRTGLAAGQPVVVEAEDTASGAVRRWPRWVVAVEPDPKASTTRVTWSEPLDPDPAAAGPWTGANVKLYRFATSSSLFGAGAPPWQTLTTARQLAVTAVDGSPLPTRGGLLHSADRGVTWASAAGCPAGIAVVGLLTIDDLVLVAAGDGGLWRSAGGGPFSLVSMGGARRYVYFVGGTRVRLLAGTARGGVYESVDDGLTWSPVTGGPPSVPTTGTIVTHQIPAVAVRTVTAVGTPARAGLPSPLVAGTDQGAFWYDGTNWAADGLPSPVFGVVADPQAGLLAATDTGVWLRRTIAGKTSWVNFGSGLTARVYGLARGDVLYAATDSGVWRLPAPGQVWFQVNGAGPTALPSGVAVQAIAAGGDTLLAGTAAGLYRSSDHGATWARVDDIAVFAWPGTDLTPTTMSTPPPPSLVQGFADHGIVLVPGAVLASTGDGYRVDNGPDTYRLTPAGGGWQLRLTGVLAPVGAVAVAEGAVLAGGSAVRPVASEWPGFAVSGTQLDLASAIGQVVPGSLALVTDESGSQPAATVLDVAAVEQVSRSAFGRQATVTRLAFPEALTVGSYPRRTSTVWLQSRLLALAPPAPAPVTALSGSVIPLASELMATPPAGRLAAVTGKPVGLAVAPLGGAYRVTAGATVAVGPAQADCTAVTVDGAGRAVLATGEGVYLIGSDTGTPMPVTDGWPPDQQGATALTSVGGDVLAGTTDGVFRLLSDGPTPAWAAAGLSGFAIVALASDTTQVVAAAATGGVFRLAVPPAGAGTTSGGGPGAAPGTASGAGPAPGDGGGPAWTALTALPGVAVVAVGGGAVYAATPAGVVRLAPDGTWQALPNGFVGAGATSLAVDGAGVVWAGSAAGLQSLQPGPDRWYPEPSPLLTGPVQAMAVGADGVVTVSTSSGLWRRSDGAQWAAVAADPGGPVAALAAAPDGTVWLAGRAAVPFTPDVPGDLTVQHHRLVCAGLALEARDVATLDQGGLPQVVTDGLAAAGRMIDASTTVVRAHTPGSCWVASSGSTLHVLATRSRGSSLTLSVWLNLVAAYPTGPPPVDAPVQTWPVERNGVLGTIRARSDAVFSLPAGPDAPALAETAVVVAASGPATTTPAAGTDLALDGALAGMYDAATVAVNLNVVPVAQGRPVRRVLGSGDPNTPHQNFSVPTPVAALPAKATGAVTGGPAGHLWVFVDGQLWTEVSSLLAAGPGDRCYRVRSKDDGTATVYFGDGGHGALLPAGQGNVVAQYLEGGDPNGQVSAGQLIQPLTRPQLVTGVYNPMPAVIPAGASAGQPVMAAVRALSRTVTLSDFQDVASAQPGVAAVSVDLIRLGLRRATVVTVATTADAPDDVLDQVAAALGAGPGDTGATWVLAAALIPVALSLEIDAPAPALAQVTAAVAQLSSGNPGDSLLASRVLSAVASVAGVAGARILGWRRDGHPPTNPTRLPARRAGWSPDSARPYPAEVLVIDGNQPRLSISVQWPRGSAAL